ncbi:protein RCC2, partial [Tanacetum coccineum]
EFKRFTRNTIFPSNAVAILEHDGVAEVSDDDTPEDTNAVDRTSMKRLSMLILVVVFTETEDGCSFSFGWNKHGQLGTGSIKNEVELSPVQCLITDVRDVACGNDFTVWLTSLKGASISMKTTLRVL